MHRTQHHLASATAFWPISQAGTYADLGRRALPCVAILATGVYLTWFVDRGWIPHDEGQLGQAAERALRGQLPHVDFDETYTGGLTWLHAAIFRAFGVQLLWLRWAVYVAAMGGVLCFYRLFRRFGGPVAASVGCILATVWAFPNYFVALPSWWNLVLTVACLLALFKAIETDRLRYVLVAGVMTGLSLAVKQTALYVVAGGVLSLMYLEQTRGARRLGGTIGLGLGFWIRTLAALGALTLVVIVLRPRLSGSTVLFFVGPLAAVCGLLVADAARRHLPPLRTTALGIAAFVAGVSIPISLVMIPYVLRGAVGEFLHGWLIAPQARTADAALDPQSPALLLLGVLIAAGAIICAVSPAGVRRWLLPAAVLAAALSPLTYANDTLYQMIWQSARLAGFAPVLAAAVLWLEIEPNPVRRAQLFTLACVMAFWSLVQYPFSATIYFCYVVPLAPALLLGLARTGGRRWTQSLVPLVVLYMAFAVLSLNRSDPGKVGVLHHPAGPFTSLGLARARLRVPENDVATYRRVVELVHRHRRTPYIYASPDCPEVYFLSASENPTRSFYDVLGSRDSHDIERLLLPGQVSVVVINRYPHFTAPPGEALFALVRSRYAHSEGVGRFEVFWTDGPR